MRKYLKSLGSATTLAGAAKYVGTLLLIAVVVLMIGNIILHRYQKTKEYQDRLEVNKDRINKNMERHKKEVELRRRAYEERVLRQEYDSKRKELIEQGLDPDEVLGPLVLPQYDEIVITEEEEHLFDDLKGYTTATAIAEYRQEKKARRQASNLREFQQKLSEDAAKLEASMKRNEEAPKPDEEASEKKE